jgi:hypothetical protein
MEKMLAESKDAEFSQMILFSLTGTFFILLVHDPAIPSGPLFCYQFPVTSSYLNLVHADN